MEDLIALGIRLNSYQTGERKTHCPNCTPTRKNKHDRSLSVKIENNGALYHCFNCGWAGRTGAQDSRKPGAGRRNAKPSWREKYESKKTW